MPTFVSVVPWDTSVDDEGFWYSLPDDFLGNIRAGSVVEVPWKDDTLAAVVLCLSDMLPSGFPAEHIRPVVRLICAFPVLSSDALAAIPYIAWEYFVRIHRALGLFLPKAEYVRLEKDHFLGITSIAEDGKSEPSDGYKEWLEIAPSEVSLHLRLAHLLGGESAAYTVVFPDELALQTYLAKNPLSDESHVVCTAHSPSPAKRRALLARIRAGAIHTLYTIREGVLLPWLPHGDIIYLEDAASPLHSFFLYQIPFLSVLRQRAKHLGVRMHILSTAPALSTLVAARALGNIVPLDPLGFPLWKTAL